MNKSLPFLFSAFVAVTLSAAEWLVPAGRITLDEKNGQMTCFSPAGASESLWKSGKAGLWRLRFQNGTTLEAAACLTNAPGYAFHLTPAGNGCDLIFTAPEADVHVYIRRTAAGVEMSGRVASKTDTVLDFELPAGLHFPAENVERLTVPQSGNEGLGVAFKKSFFMPHSVDHPSGWRRTVTGPSGYRRIFGAGLDMRDMTAAAVPLSVTDAGRTFFSKKDIDTIRARPVGVNRPPAKGQADLVLIDSVNGPYLSGSRFGGRGALWRIGSGVAEDEKETARTALLALVRRLAAAPVGRKKIACLDLAAGPQYASFTPIHPLDWRHELDRIAGHGKDRFTAIRTLTALRQALASETFELILNPYGEGFPAESVAAAGKLLDDVRDYVRRGGNWIEVGGYPFYVTMTPELFAGYEAPYPPAFADFFHLSARNGSSAALYGVRPRPPHTPWHAAVPFVPGRIACGADENGGWIRRLFVCHIPAGTSWTSPRVQMAFGRPLTDALKAYAAENTLTKPLTRKASAKFLETFKRAPLFYLYGTCAEKRSLLTDIPVPAFIHFADYIHGGFDKQYPDVLPVREGFGDAASFRAFYDEAHAAGHLVSPYTNPTWWCDHPKGPTFIAEGTAPLSVGLNGKPYLERYSKNDGWTTTLWHPAVQRVNRKYVRLFTEDFPSDLLFQDQCGARRSPYDLNPAAPSPTAYAEGMISMNEEDSQRVPLGTENGWDRIANEQTLISGCTWSIVPTRHAPAWRRLLKERFDAHDWEIEPVGLRLFHDKCIFTHHDLGQFVLDARTLSWTLALGYSLSYRCTAEAYRKDSRVRAWYAYLAMLQRRAVARIAGQPLISFRHDRTPLFRREIDSSSDVDDGLIEAVYGDVRVLANLGDVPREVSGRRLAPYGYWIEAPGFCLALPDGEAPFIEENGVRETFSVPR